MQLNSGVLALRVDADAVFAAGQIEPSWYGELVFSRFGRDGRGHPGFTNRRGPGLYRAERPIGIATGARESVTVGLAASNGSGPFARSGGLLLVRYRWDGSRDTNFGDGGQVLHPRIGPLRLEADGSGGLLVIAYRGNASDEIEPVLLRFLANGAPDHAFGEGGAVELPERFAPRTLVVQSDGFILVGGLVRGAIPGPTQTPVVERFDAQGKRDPGFTPVREPANDLGTSATLVVLSDQHERVVTARWEPRRTVLARYSRTGTPDTSFGAGGVVTVPELYPKDLDLDDGGSLVLTGFGSDSEVRTRIARLTERGQLDLTFGRGGFVTPVIRSNESVPPTSVLDGRGGLLLGGIAPPDEPHAPGAVARYEAGGTILTKVAKRAVLHRDTGRLRLVVRNTGNRLVPAELLVLGHRGRSLVRLARTVKLTLPARSRREIVVKLPRAAARALAARSRPRIVVKLRSHDRYGNQKQSAEQVPVADRG